MELGLLLAMFLFMRRVIETSSVSVLRDTVDLSHESDVHDKDEVLILPERIEVYEIDGPFFFGIANKFDESMRQVRDKPLVRIIRMRKVPFMDSTGLHNLQSFFRMSKKEGIQIVLSGVNENVHNVLDKSGFSEKIGQENICSHISFAVKRAEEMARRFEDHQAVV
jgi:SulP family sulfate permease